MNPKTLPRLRLDERQFFCLREKIEVKLKDKVSQEDAKALETLDTDLEKELKEKYVKYLLSRDKLSQKFGGTQALYWRDAIELFFIKEKDR